MKKLKKGEIENNFQFEIIFLRKNKLQLKE
jgi:hypothetical protein